LPAHARCNLLGPMGPTATASPPRSLPPPLPLPGGAYMSCPTLHHHGARLESSLGHNRAHVRLTHASPGVARTPRRCPSAYLRVTTTRAPIFPNPSAPYPASPPLETLARLSPMICLLAAHLLSRRSPEASVDG
jgi:hypothetical protein